MLASRVQTDANLTIGPHILTGASESRVSITFFPPVQGSATVSQEPGATFGQGILLTQGQTHVHLNVHDHGDAVQREWYVVYGVAPAQGVVWLESLATCREDQLKHFGASTAQRGSIWDKKPMGVAYG